MADTNQQAEEFINAFTGQISQMAEEATTKASSGGFTEFLTHIDWSIPGWDLIILIIFVVTVFFYSFALGRDRILGILISTYIALAVSHTLPFMDDLQNAIDATGFFAFKVSAFVIVFLLTFFLLFQSVLIQSVKVVRGGFFQVILFSFLLVGLLISIILSFLPSVAVSHLTFFTQAVFLSDLGKFLWIALPVIALAFLGRGRE